MTFDIMEFENDRDSLDDLTLLLNKAYGKLADMGLDYVAATQGVETTAKRIKSATACWVARDSRHLLATICYYARIRFATEPEWYHRNEVCHFGQFAVEPALQGTGIGSALLEIVETRARTEGKEELACDTAIAATHLVAFYEKRGFREVGHHRWPHANYDSCILSKSL
ncbi:MAG TPA: GNAT family N-acetyltransferase [Candidatus Baltobacteraceae bacterium]|nr:GNAT family N-acetyltransferase [Candidatus Baltobacteraceae bacterium]